MKRRLRPMIATVLSVAIVITALFAVGASAQENEGLANIAPAETNIVDATLSVANTIMYQGVLLDTNNNPRPSGSYSMTFRFYREDGSIRWNETQNVLVANGFFSVRLGAVTPINPAMFVNNQITLGVQVAGDAEMTPRQPMTQVPYAMNSQRLEQMRAFGVVNANGSSGNGHRFSSSLIEEGGRHTYVLNVSENFNINNFVTTITPVFNDTCPFAVTSSVSSSNGQMLVNLWNSSGSSVFCTFQFSVFSLPN